MGLALGFTSALFYLGCMTVMISLGREGTILFFNSLLHGLQTEPIIRMNVPLWEAFLGVLQTFVLGWLAGFLIATFYNLFSRPK